MSAYFAGIVKEGPFGVQIFQYVSNPEGQEAYRTFGGFEYQASEIDELTPFAFPQPPSDALAEVGKQLGRMADLADAILEGRVRLVENIETFAYREGTTDLSTNLIKSGWNGYRIVVESEVEE